MNIIEALNSIADSYGNVELHTSGYDIWLFDLLEGIDPRDEDLSIEFCVDGDCIWLLRDGFRTCEPAYRVKERL